MHDQALNGVPLSEGLHRQLERLLGREISPEHQGSVASFSDFSAFELEELKRLSGLHGGVLPCIAYIRFRISGKIGLSLAVSFVENVLQQGTVLDEWMRLSTPSNPA